MKQVRLTHQAIKDLDGFDHGIRERIKESLRHLAAHPDEGKPLKGQFQKDKVWSYRVWPYRVLYRTLGSWVEILSIEHRKDVYR
ncbi:MAG: type II toxin-antitoxin system RelE/ParE family toxin [Nitrospira sp.]|nr:type II toxin-antitoxin system RelE/ParE family toxin [Nitrospira sp.]MBK9945865.1 type II toxin-antitoxin system RelE/ParE family toxin [Nitrospira sp.]